MSTVLNYLFFFRSVIPYLGDRAVNIIATKRCKLIHAFLRMVVHRIVILFQKDLHKLNVLPFFHAILHKINVFLPKSVL